MDAILAEEFGIQPISQMNPARKRKEPCRWGTLPLSFREYREQHGRPDGRGGCYGQICDGRHYHSRRDVNKG